MPADAAFSTKEAAALTGLSEKAIRHEMAREIATPEVLPVGRAARRRISARDIYYLSLLASLPVAIKPEDRKDLYELISRRLPGKGRWEAAPGRLRLRGAVGVEIDVAGVRREAARRVRIYRRGRRRIVCDPEIVGGEPVFAGTRIPVRHIGLLAKKPVPAEEILEDYPALDRRDIEFARVFVELRADPGRPRKAIELRRSA